MKKNSKQILSWLRSLIMNDKTILWAVVAALLLAIFFAKASFPGAIYNKACIGIGIIGALICVFYLIICLWHPIQRDRILVKGHYIMKVITFVVLIPFIFTAGILLYNKCCKEDKILTNIDLVASDEDTTGLNDTPMFWDVYYHFVNPGTQHMRQQIAGAAGQVSSASSASCFSTVC